MGRSKMKRDQGISAKFAKQMRIGICFGELAYNYVLKGDLKTARKVMLRASRSPKYVYLSALHAIANRLDKED